MSKISSEKVFIEFIIINVSLDFFNLLYNQAKTKKKKNFSRAEEIRTKFFDLKFLFINTFMIIDRIDAM